MNYITIPYTCQRLYIGSIVIIERFPDTKWVLQNGWYMYENQQYNGWYFCSVPTRTSIPVEEDDLVDIKIISVGQSNNEFCTHNPCASIPNHVHHYKSIEKYLQGASYVSGQLVYLIPGKLYQVVHKFRSSLGMFVEDCLDKDVKNGNLIPVGHDASAKCYGLNFKSVFNSDIPTIEMTNEYLNNIGIEPTSGITFINTDVTSVTYLEIFIYTTVNIDNESTLVLTQPMSKYYSKNEIDEKFIYASEEDVRKLFD
ncbi:MAG: hypothetical protein NC320_01640 [Clostridium sp.]|nr:hypothetical protein [Clostridium sp.]